MIKNYFITTVRNIKKQKVFTFLNVFGLAIGMAGCLLAVLYIRDELELRPVQRQGGQDPPLTADVLRRGRRSGSAERGRPVAQALKEGFPEVEDAVRFRQEDSIRVKAGEESFRENERRPQRAVLFQHLHGPPSQGDPKTALASRRTLSSAGRRPRSTSAGTIPLEKRS